jgi:hypothetical protein
MQNFVRNPEGKRPLRTTSFTWEDNIRMDLKEIDWECVDWNRLTQVRSQWLSLVNKIKNFRVIF